MNTLPVRRRTAGLTLVELTVAVTVMVIAICATASTVVTTSALNQSSHETAVARKAAETMIETLRNTPFQEVFARYNADPGDDPGGPNTAPGAGFAVGGLTVAPGAPGGVAGAILLPSAGPGLFENVDDPTLGMPRDLNADAMVNAVDRAADYVVLPVTVRVSWVGKSGPRTVEYRTLLSEL